MDRPRNRALRGGKTQAELAQGLADQLVISVRVDQSRKEKKKKIAREKEAATNDKA